MIELIAEHWNLALLLVLAIIGTIFIWIMAGKAIVRRTNNNKLEVENLNYRKKLREDFKVITQDTILNADEDVLLDGITENIIMQLDNSQNDVACFEKLNNEKKYVYVLSFVEDLAFNNSVEAFFHECSQAIGKYVAPAFEMIGKTDLSDFFYKVSKSYDENNYEISITEDIKKEFENEFEKLKDGINLKKSVAEFVKNNVEKFV